MLQSLLRDRFGFKYHLEMKEGEVYILSRGSRALQLKPPKDPAADPRAIVMMKEGDIADGEAEGTNTTTDYLAIRLSRNPQLPVLNQTGITGSYDYDLPPDDAENKDPVVAVLRVADCLGLKIKRGRGPIQHPAHPPHRDALGELAVFTGQDLPPKPRAPSPSRRRSLLGG